MFGTKTDGKKLAALEKMITESTAKLNAIEETLGKQQEKLQMLSHDINSKTVSNMNSTLHNIPQH